MKKYIIIIILIIAALLFFLFCKDEPIGTSLTSETTDNSSVNIESETPASTDTTNMSTPTETKTTNLAGGTKTAPYTNNKFNFSVDFPNLVATEKTDLPPYISTIVTFGVGDQSNVDEQSRVPNSMAVYVWNDSDEFTKMFETGIEFPKETINGQTFAVRSFTNENTTSFHYAAKFNGLTYDIGVANRTDIQRFHFK